MRLPPVDQALAAGFGGDPADLPLDTTPAPKPWNVQTVPSGKARATTRHWINGPQGERAGHFPTVDAAQTECDRLNAVEAVAAAARGVA